MAEKNAKISIVFLFGLTMLIAGCGKGVRVAYEQMGAKPEISTYSWLPNTAGNSQINSAHLENVIKNAVDQELAAKGYLLDKTGQPTFLASYHAVVSKNTISVNVDNLSNARIAEYTGYSEYAVPRMEKITYDEGSLVLDFCSAKNTGIYWRGSAKAMVHLTDSQTKHDKKICQAAKNIMIQFPAR